ncbi:MAG: ATP-binding cassette domain-containing protein, partial [Phycisphaerales bacterium]
MQPIQLTLSCSYTTATEPTRRVCEVASMFGLGVDRRRTIAVVPEVTLPITPASIVFITGASGGGKSTLLRLIGEQLRQREGVRVVEFGRDDVAEKRAGNEPQRHRGAEECETEKKSPSVSLCLLYVAKSHGECSHRKWFGVGGERS